MPNNLQYWSRKYAQIIPQKDELTVSQQHINTDASHTEIYSSLQFSQDKFRKLNNHKVFKYPPITFTQRITAE